VEIAPNPFNYSTRILVSSLEADKATVQITDLSGHLICSGLINTNEYQNIGEFLPAGVYLLQVFVGNEKIINKIVKQ
jgi:ribosome biogenesis protein Tsr3